MELISNQKSRVIWQINELKLSTKDSAVQIDKPAGGSVYFLLGNSTAFTSNVEKNQKHWLLKLKNCSMIVSRSK
jgi:hypothetical protein